MHTASPFGVVLTGLDPTLTYNLVIYGAQNFAGGRGGQFDLASPDLPARETSGDQQTTFAEDVNYVRFDNLVPTGPDNRIRWLVSVGAENVAIFNGFEIEAVQPSSVPEPGAMSLVLAGLAVAALGRRGR
jgi:hypothetical protein